MRTAVADVSADGRLPIQPKPVRPIVGWSVIGAVALTAQIYVFGSWILSGDATPTPTGPDPVPTFMVVSLRVFEVAAPIGAATMLYWFLVRPWRRERRVPTEGLLVPIFLLSVWLDPFANYFTTWYTYNAAAVNFGSWMSRMPGSLPPTGRYLAEPILGMAPAYVLLGLGIALLGAAVMRSIRRKAPHMGAARLVLVGFVVCAALSFVAETAFIRTGIWAYPGSPRWMTFFHGHYYQYPAPELFFSALYWIAYSSLLFFRDDKGRTIAERGIDQLALSNSRRAAVRFLSLNGVVNVIFLFCYGLPMALIGLHAEAWPADFDKRSYLRSGLCGPGTDFACPSPQFPIPRPDSLHVTPDGELRRSSPD